MKNIEDWVIGLRREFHRYPEIAFQEKKTSEKIKKVLTDLGLEVVDGFAGTGITGLIRGKGEGETIGLRADMDALPIREENDVEYISEVDGMMHACGHDAHMAIMLGVAGYIVENDMQKTMNGNVKFIFQPAEEGVRGAKAIIKEGVLENPRVDTAFACHVSNDWPAGEAGVYERISHASSDRFKLTVKSVGAHAARPEKTSDSLLAACAFVTQIQSIVARNVAPTESAVVSVGTINGGTAANILPQEVALEGTVRAFKEEVRQLVKRRLKEFAHALKESYALKEVDFEYKDGCPPCINDSGAVSRLKAAAEHVLGADNVDFFEPKMGGEDFAYFAEKCPSALLRLGTGNPETGAAAQAHSSHFDIDEKALMYGVKIFVNIVEESLCSDSRE